MTAPEFDPDLVEQATVAALDATIPTWRATYGLPSEDDLSWTRAVLTAVAPALRATALREAAGVVGSDLANEIGSGHTSTYSVRKWLHERANRIEGGA